MAVQEAEVVIIGGSYAGLSAALALGRSMRNTVIVDSGQPCNRQTPRAHNLLGHDGRNPAEIAAIGKQELLKYPTVQFVNDNVESVEKDHDLFELTTAKGLVLRAKKLLFASGIHDVMPEIPGF